MFATTVETWQMEPRSRAATNGTRGMKLGGARGELRAARGEAEGRDEGRLLWSYGVEDLLDELLDGHAVELGLGCEGDAMSEDVWGESTYVVRRYEVATADESVSLGCLEKGYRRTWRGTYPRIRRCSC